MSSEEIPQSVQHEREKREEPLVELIDDKPAAHIEEPLVELLRPQEITVRSETLEALNQRTQQSPNAEFLAFLLGKGTIAETAVEVGRGYEGGVSTLPEEVVQRLRPYVQNGHRVIADYHNHPANVAVYAAAGLPAENVIAPSISDLKQDTPLALQREFGQAPYAHIIATYIPERGVLVNGFNTFRHPTREEVSQVTFPDLTFVPDSTPNPIIELLPPLYTDARKLRDGGLFEPIKINTLQKDGSIKPVANPLATVLQAKQ